MISEADAESESEFDEDSNLEFRLLIFEYRNAINLILFLVGEMDVQCEYCYGISIKVSQTRYRVWNYVVKCKKVR